MRGRCSESFQKAAPFFYGQKMINVRSHLTHLRWLLFMVCLVPAAASGKYFYSAGGNTGHPLDEDAVVRLTYNCHFDEALNLLGDSTNKDIDPIKWNFFRGVVLWHNLVFLDSAMASDKSVDNNFTRAIAQTIDIGERTLAQNPNDTAALFCTGFAFGYLAKYDASKGDEFKAASDGKKGLSYHRKFIEMSRLQGASSPAICDAYFSLALFNYYTSGLAWYLKPLLFILGESGSKEKAYEYLTLAGKNGRFTKYEAEDILGEFYAREEQFDSVAVVYHHLISQFPDAFLFYFDKLSWALANHKEYNRCAMMCLEAIKASYTHRLTQVDSLYLAKIYFRLAGCYEETGNYGEAMQTFNGMIDRNMMPSFAARAHFSVGKLYERANDPQDAIREYEWVVNSGTVPELVNQARERLGNLTTR